MGEIEKKGKERARKRDLKKAVLGAVQAAALAGALLAVPNLPVALHKLGLMPASYDSGNISRSRKRFIRQGLIVERDGRLRITDRGQRELRLIEVREAARNLNRKWDGRWRILIFDIPEYRKAVRNKIRRSLQSVGFMRLQDSVWIYPYDCEDLIVLLKADFKIGKDVLYMIVDELEGDYRVREYFRLRLR